MSVSVRSIVFLVTLVALASFTALALLPRGSADRPSIASQAQQSENSAITSRPGKVSQAWTRVSSNSIVHAIVLDPVDSRKLFAATTSGLMRSDDGGGHWQLLTLGLPSIDRALWSVVMLNHGHEIAVGGDTSHVFTSQDAGQHWQQSSQALGQGGIYALAADPHAATTLIAGASTGIWRSTDTGLHWQKVYDTASANVTGFAWYQVTVYAGVLPGPRQVVASFDSGRTWRSQATGFIGDVGIMAVDAGKWPQPTVLAGTMGHRVWRLDAHTSTWNESAIGLPEGSHGSALYNSQRRIWVGTMGNGIYSSIDGGRTWAPFGPPLPHYAAIVLSLAVTGKDLFAGTAQGIYRLAGAVT